MSPTLTFTGNGLTVTGTGFTFGIPMSVTVVSGGGGGGGGNAEDMSITLASTTFNNGDTIGTDYKLGGMCGGNNTSPQLNWTVTGSNTDVAEFRLRCLDIDASNFVHWSVDNIKASSSSLAENADWTAGQSADGNGVTINNTGFGGGAHRSNGWAGPCPPSGTHTYQFQLTAHDSNGDAVSQGGSNLESNTISFERS